MVARRETIISGDYTGHRFGRLTCIGWSNTLDSRGEASLQHVRCDCGTEKTVSIYSLRSGRTGSCGCLNREASSQRATKHGHGHRSPTYNAYRGAIDRCSNPSNRRWARYGGRGIKVCDRWMEGFANFLADMGERPGPGYELDRRDNDGHYSPENCRWVSKRQNLNNTSRSRLLDAFGERRTLAQWSRHTGINPETIRRRLERGWSIERALLAAATMTNDLATLRTVLAGADLESADAMRAAIRQAIDLINTRLYDRSEPEARS